MTIKARLRDLLPGDVVMINGHQVHCIDGTWYVVGLSPVRRARCEVLRLLAVKR
jgi:hypothetical protein